MAKQAQLEHFVKPEKKIQYDLVALQELGLQNKLTSVSGFGKADNDCPDKKQLCWLMWVFKGWKKAAFF